MLQLIFLKKQIKSVFISKEPTLHVGTKLNPWDNTEIDVSTVFERLITGFSPVDGGWVCSLVERFFPRLVYLCFFLIGCFWTDALFDDRSSWMFLRSLSHLESPSLVYSH